MDIALIAAVASNGVLGCDGKLPWRLSGDLAFFKRTTLGKPVLMGRKTWESVGQPLPGRSNIVISRQAATDKPAAVHWMADLDSALALAERIAQNDGGDELMVAGGAEIYALTLPLAQRLYLTEVHAAPGGDVFFPPWCRHDWREISRQTHRADAANSCDYSFVHYERRRERA